MTKEELTAQPRSAGVQSVELSIRVLRVLVEAEGALPLRDIGKRANLSPSQTHRYLQSYIRGGLVEQDTATGYYDLGPFALQMGLAALTKIDPVQLAFDAARALGERWRMAVGVSVWGPYGQTLVRWRRGPDMFFSVLTPGSVFSMLNTAAGRISLAFLPEHVTAPLVDREVAALDRAHQSVDMDALAAEIDMIRREHRYQMAGHSTPGMRSIAAPVLNSEGELQAVIALLGPIVPDGNEDPTFDALRRAAKDISVKLGYSIGPDGRPPSGGPV